MIILSNFFATLVGYIIESVEPTTCIFRQKKLRILDNEILAFILYSKLERTNAVEMKKPFH